MISVLPFAIRPFIRFTEAELQKKLAARSSLLFYTLVFKYILKFLIKSTYIYILSRWNIAHGDECTIICEYACHIKYRQRNVYLLRFSNKNIYYIYLLNHALLLLLLLCVSWKLSLFSHRALNQFKLSCWTGTHFVIIKASFTHNYKCLLYIYSFIYLFE